jgi:PAS domain S-box-containing protein
LLSQIKRMFKFDPVLWPKPTGSWSYGIAVLSVAAAMVVLRWPPLHLQQAPASMFLCAILLSAWFGGARPGLLATALSTLAYYYFLPPTDSLGPKLTEIPRLVVFMATAVFVWSLSAAQRNATESLRRARDDLRMRFKEIQRANEILQEESRERIQIGNRLRRSEAYLAAAQRLTHTGSFGWSVQSGEIRWSDETFRIFECDPKTKPTLEVIWQRTHPDDVAFVRESIDGASRNQHDFDIEHRLVMQDGSVKHVHVVAHAETNESGELEFVGAVRDTTESKRVEKELRRSEDFLLEAQKLSHTGSWRHDIASDAISVSPEIYRIHDIRPDDDPSNTEFFFTKFHPEDRKHVVDLFERAEIERTEFEVDYRIVLPDGTIKHLHTTGHPILNESGALVEFVGSAMDVTAAKKAEETLRRSESYLAEAQRLSHTGSWASIPAMGEIKYLSEECYRVLGFDPQAGQPRYKEFFERIHPDDQAKTKEAIETAALENREFEFDYRIVHPNGDIRDIHTIGHPVFSPSGDFIEFVGTVMDITDRKRAEDQTRLIIDTVPAQLWTESPDGVVDFVNRRWVDYTGMTLEQAVGSGWNRMVHPDDIERVLNTWRTLIAEGKPREIESRLRRSDGEYRWFLSRCYPLIDRSGHILGWYGTDTDIHDRKEMEERLRQSEAHLQEAQTLGRIGSWAFNIAKGTVSGSPELFRIFGRDPGEEQLTKEMLNDVRYMPVFRTSVHPEDLPFVEEFTSKARNEPNLGRELEYRIVLPDGSVKHVHSVAHPVLDDAGHVIEYIGTIMDVTERKRAEEAVRQSHAELAHVSRVTTMGELTASLAHEVNQPIAAAVTSANSCYRWLTAEVPNLDKARAAAMRIVNDGTRAAEIITRIRLLFQKGTPQWQMVDFNAVIEEMIILLRGEAMQSSIAVRTELAPDLPQVMGDRVQLQQVMMNLMMNSIDAMKIADGTRELAVKSQRAENDQLLVSVSDTGIGLPTENADHIFDAFFTTKPHGTGMGLRICRSIVESHGGRLRAGNNPARGANFCLTLPAKLEARE